MSNGNPVVQFKLTIAHLDSLRAMIARDFAQLSADYEKAKADEQAQLWRDMARVEMLASFFNVEIEKRDIQKGLT